MRLAQAGTNEILNTLNLVITGGVTIIVAWLGVQRRNDKKQAEVRHSEAVVERAELKEAVKPSNGHDTLGEALEAVEKRIHEMAERLARGDARFDNMEEAEHRIAEQLAIVTTTLTDKLAEVLALQGDLRMDTRRLTASVAEHHHAWDDPAPDGSPSLLDWAEQQRLKEQQAKRKKGRA